MFGFLNSFILPALVAASIPIIIHFFNKRKTKTILFSSIHFLKMLESKRIKHLRIYQFLLILLRTLFIVFIVLAFARPTLKSDFFLSGSANITAVIILDDSYSMCSFTPASTYFEKARTSLTKVLNTFSEDDKVFLLIPSRPAENPEPLDLTDLSFIASLSAGYSSPDLEPVFTLAAEIFSEHVNYNRELYFISDFRINQKHLSDSTAELFPTENLHFFHINPGQDFKFNNAGIDTVVVRKQIVEQNKPFSLSVMLRNYNEEEPLETRVHLFEAQQRLAMKSVTMPAGGTADIELPVSTGHFGTLPMRIELDNDDLAVDNEYFLNVSVSGALDVLVISNQFSGPLDAALGTLSEQSLLNIHRVNYQNIPELSRFNLVVLSDPPQLTPEIRYRLSQFIAGGHSLVLVPGDRTNSLLLNEAVASVSGLKPFKTLKSIPAGQGYFSTQKRMLQEPLFNTLFSGTEHNFNPPEIYKYFPLQPGGQYLINLKNNNPLLTSYPLQDGSGMLYLFSSSFNLGWNNLSLHGFFIPMLYRVFYLAGQSSQSEAITTVDKNLSVHIPGQGINETYFLKDTQEESIPLNPVAADDGVSFLFKAPLVPGHYRIFKNEQVLKRFSVNVAASELHKPYFNFGSFKGNIYKLTNIQNYPDKIQQTRTGLELWRLFAGIAFLMLLFEIILIKSIEGKSEGISD